MLTTRRNLLAAGLACTVSRPLRAAPPTPIPVVDKLNLMVLVDGTVARFQTPVERLGLKILPPVEIATSYLLALRAEWGYSLLADAQVGGVSHRILIDFGYTPETLSTNMEILGIEPMSIEAMVLSHGHRDHYGGIPAILGRSRRGTPLYVGGEEAFCARLRGRTATSVSFGLLDRTDLVAGGLDLRVAPTPQTVAGVALTTGRIPLVSAERPVVPTSMLPGQGCLRSDLDADRRDSDFFVDDAVHELGTVFHLRDKGLVVIGSCSHRGIINTVRAAQAASGVEQIYAICGGFHLVPPQTNHHVIQTIDLMRALKPRYIFPGHCSGEGFIASAIAQMPDQVFRTVVGSRITLG